MNTLNNQQNLVQDSEEFDLGKILRLVLMQSKLVLAIVLFCTSLGVANYFTSTKYYKFDSLIQVFSDQNNFGQMEFLDFYSNNTGSSDLANIEGIYKSRTNLLTIINNERLYITSETVTHAQKKKLFRNIEYRSQERKNYTLDLRENIFFLSSDDGLMSNELLYGELYQSDDIDFILEKTDLIGSFEFQINPPSSLVKRLSSNFSFEKVSSQQSFTAPKDGLLKVSYISSNRDEAKSVLDFSNNFYISENIKVESEQARKAINFIENQIKNVESELDLKKISLKNFKENNQSVDVEKEVSAIIETLTSIQLQINQIDIEISSASNNFTTSNPLYQNLLKQRGILANQKSEIEQRIRNLPNAQQEYIDLFQSIDVTEQAYLELVNKRLEYSIKEASTLGNIRIIDNAYISGRVSPTINSIILIFLISSILSVIAVIIRGIFYLPISNPAEFIDNHIYTNISGVIPKYDGVDEKDRFKNSLESLIVNLEKIKTPETNGAITYVITSPTAENGKSFVSREVAKKISTLNKKVLLIDFDFKRGDQHTEFGLGKVTEEAFNNIDESTIERFKIDENLYFIPKITKIKNSFEFIYSNIFEKQMKFFKENFDYVIIDTAPLLSVSDSSILLGLADVKIGVCRHAYTKISELKQMLAISEQIGSKLDALVYNGYEKPQSYYGYYGLYGNYNYQYYAQKYLYESYDYGKDDE